MKNKQTVADWVLIQLYSRYGSVWKVAKAVGLCGQSVHERLVQLRVNLIDTSITPDEANRVITVYKSGIKKGDGKLCALSKEIGRSKQCISRWAATKGLTDPARKMTDSCKEANGVRSSARIKTTGHPKGMKGKKHSSSAKAVIGSKSMSAWFNSTKKQRDGRVLKGLKTKAANGTMAPPRSGCTWKAGWRKIGGRKKYYRSRWEANYARVLEFLKQAGEIDDWEHEPDTFWFDEIKRGCRSYLPDFKVWERGRIYYVEVKGWMDDRSKTKLKRMKKYHPDVELRVVAKSEYNTLKRQLSSIIKDWE